MKDYYSKREYSNRKGWHKVCMVKIICDKCKHTIIDTTEDDAYERQLSEKYAGLNYGTHECAYCRKTRERAYDLYVTRPH